MYSIMLFFKDYFLKQRKRKAKPVSITVLFDFIGNEKINEINIKTASIFDLDIEKVIITRWK